MRRAKTKHAGWGAFLLAALAVTVLAACGGGSGETSSGDTGAEETDGVANAGGELCESGTIDVGMAKAKTGSFAFFDNAGGQGSVVAAEQINAEGGVDGCELDINWQDTKSDPALAKQVAENLIGEGAEVIIAPSDFDVGIGASLAAKEAEVFGMSPEASSLDWPKAAGPYFVVQGVTTTDIGTAQALFADEQGWGTSYVVTNKAYDFFRKMQERFEAIYEGDVIGSTVVAEEASDYSPVISKIRSTSPAPDVIYLNDYFPHVGTFIKQLRAAGIDTPVLGNPTYASPELVKVVGKDGMKDVYYASQNFYEGSDVDPKMADFVKRYEDKYGVFPENSNAVSGYEGVLILAQALEGASSTEASEITEKMTGATDEEVVGATIYEWKDGGTVRSLDIVAYDPAEGYVVSTKIDPREAE